MAEGERLDEIFEGYEWDESARLWKKWLEDSQINLPGIGNGHFFRFHSVDEDYGNPALTDIFLLTDGLLFSREIAPYPPVGFLSGRPYAKIRIEILHPFPETTNMPFTDCEIWSWKDIKPHEKRFFAGDSYLSIWRSGKRSYRVSYDINGTIVSFNVSGEVSFNFFESKIASLDLDERILGELKQFLNTGRNVLFNEEFFKLTQNQNETTVRVIKPINNQDLMVVSVPTQINMENINSILIGEGKEWLQLAEHVPIKFEIPGKI